MKTNKCERKIMKIINKKYFIYAHNSVKRNEKKDFQ